MPVPGRLSAALLEWKGVQEGFKGRCIMAPGGINFAARNLCLQGIRERRFPIGLSTCACAPHAEPSGWGRSQLHGLRHSAATILLNHVGKDLREIHELLRHRNIRTTVRYSHVGYEQTRQTAEALSRALE